MNSDLSLAPITSKTGNTPQPKGKGATDESFADKLSKSERDEPRQMPASARPPEHVRVKLADRLHFFASKDSNDTDALDEELSASEESLDDQPAADEEKSENMPVGIFVLNTSNRPEGLQVPKWRAGETDDGQAPHPSDWKDGAKAEIVAGKLGAKISASARSDVANEVQAERQPTGKAGELDAAVEALSMEDFDGEAAPKLRTEAETKTASVQAKQADIALQQSGSVQVQLTTSNTSQTPSVRVAETLRAEPSWSAYFRETGASSAQPLKTIKIQLHPAELGMVTAQIRTSGDALEVEINTDTIEAQKHLAADADQILRSLRQVGIDVDRVTVHHTGAEADAKNAGSQEWRDFSSFQGQAGGDGSQSEGNRRGAVQGDHGERASSQSGAANQAAGRYI